MMSSWLTSSPQALRDNRRTSVHENCFETILPKVRFVSGLLTTHLYFAALCFAHASDQGACDIFPLRAGKG
jgi:hypothetical protein